MYESTDIHFFCKKQFPISGSQGQTHTLPGELLLSPDDVWSLHRPALTALPSQAFPTPAFNLESRDSKPGMLCFLDFSKRFGILVPSFPDFLADLSQYLGIVKTLFPDK